MQADVIRGLSVWDYGIIAAYFVFILSIGWIFRRLSKDASDYFRGGGNMLWWMAGMAAMMGTVSTWSFTGGAAKCYADGFLLPLTWIMATPVTLVIQLLIAARLRRTRVITAMEAIHRRFGVGTEQCFTWVTLIMGLFFGGMALNTLSVFLGSAFGVDVGTTILVIGVVCTVVALLGGQWAMAATSFVQGLIMHLVIFVLIYGTLQLPEIGGAANLLDALPERHTRFDLGARAGIVAIWLGWSLLMSFIGPLDLRNAGRFVSVKDDRNARIMVLMMATPGLIGLPVLMQLPSMAAATVFPDLGALFPHLRNPEEGAYVAMAFKVLPQGLMGVMICGMLAASMDLPLNYFAGIGVRNIYLRFIRPDATDRQQLRMGRVMTVGFGVIMIASGMAVDAFRKVNLFDFFQLFNAMALPPMMVPMVLGLVIKRTPSWSGWSTVVVGLIAGAIAKTLYTPEFVQHLMGYDTPLTERERIDSQFVVVSVATFALSSAWFLMTMFFYRYSRPESRARVEALFADYRRPIDRAHGEGKDQDGMQYRIVGRLCVLMGGFLTLCVAIPNPPGGRLAFLFIGGTCLLLGLWMEAIGRRKPADPA